MHTEQRNIFPGADDSWIEARVFNRLAVEAVPPSHPLARFLREELDALEPAAPAAQPPPLPPKLPPNTSFICTRGSHTASLQFARESGSLESLSFGPNGAAWPRLVDLRYVTTSDGGRGVTCDDASKCPNPVSGAWAPSLLSYSTGEPSGAARNETCRVVLELGFNETLHDEKYGAPAAVTAEYEIAVDL